MTSISSFIPPIDYGLNRPTLPLSEYESALLQLAVTLSHPFLSVDDIRKTQQNYAAHISAHWVLILSRMKPELAEVYGTLETIRERQAEFWHDRQARGGHGTPKNVAAIDSATADIMASLGL